MKNQASINLKIVDSPIDSKALEGHLMLRATSDGLKLYDNTGVETPIGGEVDESRLLPTGGQNGYILGYNESADRGNSADVKLLLQNALTDSAYGNESPAAITQQGVTLTSDNTLQFDGNGSYVNAVLPNEIFAADSEWTIDGWIKPTANSSEWNYILTDNTGDWGTRSIGLTWNSKDQVLEQDTGGYVASVIKSPNWPNDKIACAADTWHFIAVEKQKTSTGWALNYYLNGSLWLQVEFTGEFVPFDSTNPFRFGGWTSDGGREFKGEANRIRVTAGARYGGKAFTVPDRATDYEAPTGLPAWVTGYVKSVNGQTPDEDGNVVVETSGSVDLTDYSTTKIKLTSTDGDVRLVTGNGNGILQLTVTDTNNPDRATLQTPGVWDIKLDSYLTKISGTQQMDIEANGSQCPVKITAGGNGGNIQLVASGTLTYNGASLNAANGLVQLGSDGKIPTSLYEAGSVDLTDYTTESNISIKSTGYGTTVTLASVNGDVSVTSLQTATFSGSNMTGIGSTSSVGGYLTLNAHDLNTLGLKLASYSDVAFANQAGGLAVVGTDGKLPSSIIPESSGGTVDLSNYTGGINLTSSNDSPVAIKFKSGNPTYNAELTMDPSGVTLSGYGDVTLQHTGGSYLRLTSGEAALSVNSSLSLSAQSRLTIYAKEGIYLGGAGFNTAGGLVTVGEDGKISSSLYNAGSAGATPPLLFTCPTSSTAVHLEITAGKLADGSDNAALINTSTSAEHRAKVYGNSGNTDWIECPETGFGTNFNRWPIRVDVTDLLDPSEISYIRYRWVSTSGDASDWYSMVYPCATEAPVASGSGSGGDTSALEKRVTTLETTVGTLNASVDEILADYGEGSGALVYRVVASATEPENPTEGMVWIQTK